MQEQVVACVGPHSPMLNEFHWPSLVCTRMASARRQQSHRHTHVTPTPAPEEEGGGICSGGTPPVTKSTTKTTPCSTSDTSRDGCEEILHDSPGLVCKALGEIMQLVLDLGVQVHDANKHSRSAASGHSMGRVRIPSQI
jgi:hypothetical protein